MMADVRCKRAENQYRLNSSNFSNFLTTKTRADWVNALSAFFVAMLQHILIMKNEE